MRLFVAFEIPESVRGAVCDRVERIRPELPPSRWVARDNLHLTLHFVGETQSDSLAPLERGLHPVFARASAFQMQLHLPLLPVVFHVCCDDG